MKSLVKLLIATIGLAAFSISGFAHAKEFQPPYVDTLIPPYLAVQAALAGDDLDTARTAAQALLAATLQGPSFTAMTDPVELIASAPDMAAARKGFLMVSTEMISLVDHVGTSGKQSLFVAHCPMAFGGKGGDWLQGDRKVYNPYYGSMMLRCGSIKNQISGHAKTAIQDLDRVHANVPAYKSKSPKTNRQSKDKAPLDSAGCGMACCASDEK